MQYIRTKDGRIGIISSVQEYNGPYPTHFFVRFPNDKEIHDYNHLHIVKQADTIKELCDEYIIVQSNGKYHTSHSNSFMKDYINAFIKQTKVFENGSMVYIKDIVGAIWITDAKSIPTLKPVAKMKGVLPNGEIDWELI